MNFPRTDGKKKGVVTQALSAFFIVALILTTLAGFNYLNQASRTEQVRQLSIQKDTSKLSTVDAGIPTTCIYSYANVRPYVNYDTEDDAGTAVNPTWYIYTSNPSTLTFGAYWGDERAWSDESGEYYTSGTATSGSLQKTLTSGLETWAHASLSGYEDVFIHYTIPTCGDITPGDAVDTNAGIDVGVFQMTQFDTTAWASSHIDLAVSANATNAEHSKDVTYRVADNKKVKLDQMKIKTLERYASADSGEGLRKLQITIEGQTFLIYDNAAGIDKTSYQGATDTYVYDSNSYPADKEKLQSIEIGEDQVVDFGVKAWVDTLDAQVANDGYLSNGEPLGNVTLYDVEGNALLSAQGIRG